MKTKFFKNTVLLIVFLLVGSFIFYSFQSDHSINNNKKEKSAVKSSLNDNLLSANTYNHSSDMKCGGDSKKASKKSKCGAGKCGEGKCGSGKCGDGKAESKKHSILDADSNGDGKVSLAEFSAHATTEFPNKDTNHDGKLSSDECGMFDKFNTNGDGFVSKEEFAKGHTMVFNKMDKNKDGFVTSDEAKAFKKCGDGKCGDGAKGESKCGAGKCGGDSKAKKSKSDNKCGAGKCGKS